MDNTRKLGGTLTFRKGHRAGTIATIDDTGKWFHDDPLMAEILNTNYNLDEFMHPASTPGHGRALHAAGQDFDGEVKVFKHYDPLPPDVQS